MTEPAVDRRRIRLGLGIVAAVFVLAVVLGFIVDAAFAKAIMFAVALTAFVRAFLLARSLVQEADR